MSNENNVKNTNADVRHGKIIFIVSAACIPVWLLLSTGDFTGIIGERAIILPLNIFSLMHVDFFTICSESYEPGSYRQPYNCAPLMSFSTSNLILLSVMMGTYGILVWQSLVSSPVPLMRSIISRIRRGERLAPTNSAPTLPEIPADISSIKEGKHASPTDSAPILRDKPEDIQINQNKSQSVLKYFILIYSILGLILLWITLGFLGAP